MSTDEKVDKGMSRMNKKVIAAIVLLFIGFLYSSFAFASTPIDISRNNVTSNKFTISWVTETEEACQVNYGAASSLGKTAYDDRGKATSGRIHHVTITGLAANTQYYYEIISGGQVYKNNGQPYTISTGISLTLPSGTRVAYGRVLLSSGDVAIGAIVTLKVLDNDGVGTPGASQTLSVLTDNSGWWNMELSGVRTQDLTSYFSFSESGDSELISARIDKYAPTTITIDTDQDAPAATITLGWILNMTLMQWYQNEKPYYTGAAACQMILNYIRQGAGASDLTQDEIYAYAHSAQDNKDLVPGEMNNVLGRFDPYDSSISNFYDFYDSLPAGNPYQGYNFTVDAYSASDPDAINHYMRDICHWMAFTATQEEWWKRGDLVARPNTPAAVPIFGDTQGYNHWVVVKGAATNNNPNPDPLGNPWNTPDFTIYGLWMKDPLISGVGENKYATADECRNTYFKPLNTADAYNGMYVQVAEPPAQESTAVVTIPSPVPDSGNIGLVKTGLGELNATSQGASLEAMALTNTASTASSARSKKKDLEWKNIIDPFLLTDNEAVKAFEDTLPDTPILVKRLDKKGGDYYLIPYLKQVKVKSGRLYYYRYLVSGVMVIDARKGYFKEASWMKTPAEYTIISKAAAIQLVRKSLRRPVNNAYVTTCLAWEPGKISSTPYKPFWKVVMGGAAYYVSQEGKVYPAAPKPRF
jgi:hypothetical protein